MINDIFRQILEIGITRNYHIIDLKVKEIINILENRIENEQSVDEKKSLQVKLDALRHTLHKEVNSVSFPESKISEREYKRRYEVAKSQLSSDLLGLFENE